MLEQLDQMPLGFIPNKGQSWFRIPIWDGDILLIKKLVILNEFKRMGPFKFIPLFFDRISAND